MLNSAIKILLFSLYRLTLELSYVRVINPELESVGSILQFNSGKYIVSWVSFLIFSSIMLGALKGRSLKASTIFIFFLFIFNYVPGCSLFGLVDAPYAFFMAFSVYWMIILVSGRILCLSHSKKIVLNMRRKPEAAEKNKYFDLLMILSCFYVFYVSLRYNGLSLHFNLLDVYGIRLDAREKYFGFMSGYLLAWAPQVIAFGAIIYFGKKAWLKFGICCLIQWLLFSLDGQKTVALLIPVSLIAFKLYDDKRLNLIIITLITLIIIGVLEYLIFGTMIIILLSSYRVIYGPAMLNIHYFDFFSVNPPDMLRQSFLRNFGIKSEYDMPIMRIIGSLYDYKSIENNANNGMFGDAFMNFGYFGVLFYPLLLIFMLYLFNMFSKYVDKKYYIVSVILLSNAFMNGPLFTVILTNGFLVALVLVSLIPESKSR